MVLAAANSMSPTLVVGMRIESNGYFGTVKYIGEIHGHSGIWLGVDWDDAKRGKHNGSVAGVAYFTATHPTSGSFVKPSKVNLGRSAIEAVTSRYGHQEDENSIKMHKEELLSIQQTIKAPFLEMVGFDKVSSKQRDFQNLHVVNLRMLNVNHPGEANELKELCPNITELDISKNLFTNWTSVFEMCTQLNNLQWLNVSENMLKLTDDYKSYQFPNIRTLICSQMQLEWEDVIKLHSVFPNCRELRVPLNSITSINFPENKIWTEVTLLDLEGNPIHDWKEILKLSSIERLESLNVQNIGISRIWFDNEVNGKTKHLPNLKKLVLSHNLINDWQSIGELDKLEKFEDLKFLRNPLLDKENYATCVQYIIARIGNLKWLNGTPIKPEERKGAEYDYVRTNGTEWLNARDDPVKRQNFLLKYNRYDELIRIYGALEESELKTQSYIIEDGLVEVKIIHQDKTIVKKLPPSMTIQRLIILTQRLFNIEGPSLSYVSQTQPDFSIPLDDPDRELSFYSIECGDTITVN